jgi:predicted nucleic acid-binding protein
VTVFVDTSAFLALLDGDDTNNPAAIACFGALRRTIDSLHTTSYVLVETAALVQSRLGIGVVRDFQKFYRPLVGVSWLGEQEHERAVATLLVASRRRPSLVDCTSFDCMRRLGLSRVFTFDRHFADQGFKCLPASS